MAAQLEIFMKHGSRIEGTTTKRIRNLYSKANLPKGSAKGSPQKMRVVTDSNPISGSRIQHGSKDRLLLHNPHLLGLRNVPELRAIPIHPLAITTGREEMSRNLKRRLMRQ